MEGTGPDTTTIVRDASAPGFRLLHVGATGNLTVNGMTLTGGSGGSDTGGGLFNNGGVVTFTLTNVTNNPGGGLVNNGGAVSLAQSTVSQNGISLGISNAGVMHLYQSTVSDHRGGGLSNRGEVNITQSVFANNTNTGPGGLFTSGTGS